MIAIVGTFAAVLMRSARTHTDVAVQEEGRSQAFHSSEAGVEFVRVNIQETLELINDNEEGDIIYPKDEREYVDDLGENINFKIKIEDKNENKISSIGKHEIGDENYREKVEIVVEDDENISSWKHITD